jgi:hypothetical protein
MSNNEYRPINEPEEDMDSDEDSDFWQRSRIKWKS